MITDVIIIGGGASGMFSAVYLKKKYPELTVKVLEALPRVCKKLCLTGNGRCNITNKNINISRYQGENVDFCEYALQKYNRNFTQSFFEEIGVPFTFEADKGFPSSFQAGSVVDCLRFSAEELGVVIHTDTKVDNIQLSGSYYKVISDKVSFLCKNLIIATGLYSGGESLGCDGSILKILKTAGYNLIPTFPAIVQLKTPNDIVRQLKGIKINAQVTLYSNNENLRTDYGEVLFCDYGLSGPPILQLSSTAIKHNNCKISIDLMPQTNLEAIIETLSIRASTLYNRTLEEFLTGMLNKRLGQVILKLAGCKLTDKARDLSYEQIKKCAMIIKSFDFDIIGHTGFTNSQATQGGLDTKQFYDYSMMSKTNKNLYCIGEILDICGDCGGFNLQWAWSSAACACDSIGNGGI